MRHGVKIWVPKLRDILGLLEVFSGIGDRCSWCFPFGLQDWTSSMSLCYIISDLIIPSFPF